jgi:hypothetical protein
LPSYERGTIKMPKLNLNMVIVFHFASLGFSFIPFIKF